ncbi:3-isopropylmalate dehydratase small subunit [Rhodococcus koreensis]|uniref:3-isopropylmalate dehydratase small subunit n=1 Tax=Rhodococcus koreensis TaxID=99653 RepID=UPI0019820462|nr:3-isopropylmalate dehydratase small subunit [Rhodococcus koreensis]QSE86350.1 3-isopropylmalate dehydratase small subunit [Rhodococcus koreensis]
MDKFDTCRGIAVPLRRAGIDTDQICPATYMKRITRTGYEDALFATWRSDPDFILNTPPYRTGNILVAGPDFGIGSSREHAVWALRDYGFRVVLSPRFADIFRGNAGKNGLLAGQVEQGDIEALWTVLEEEPHTETVVDLETCTVTAGALTVDFTIDQDSRWRLRAGLDDIDIALQHTDRIRAFEATRPWWLPRTTVETTDEDPTVSNTRPAT